MESGRKYIFTFKGNDRMGIPAPPDTEATFLEKTENGYVVIVNGNRVTWPLSFVKSTTPVYSGGKRKTRKGSRKGRKGSRKTRKTNRKGTRKSRRAYRK